MKNYILAALLLLLFLVLLPVTAMADSLGSTLLRDALPTLLELGGIVLLGAALYIARLLAKRFNMDVKASHELMIRAGVRRLIQWAEEKIPDGGAAKEDAVVSRAVSELGITTSQARDMVKEELPNLAHLGIGVVGKKLHALTSR